MILSGPEIERQVSLGNILINPFDPKCLGPNSYDVHLGTELIELAPIRKECWDVTRSIPPHNLIYHKINEGSGFVLRKRVAYLAHIVETIRCDGFVPWLDGRSTIGRYFLQCHMTAGRGDDGWEGKFTLEMMALARSVRIFPYLPIAQISFFQLAGERAPYHGRYQNQTSPTLPKPLSRR